MRAGCTLRPSQNNYLARNKEKWRCAIIVHRGGVRSAECAARPREPRRKKPARLPFFVLVPLDIENLADPVCRETFPAPGTLSRTLGSTYPLFSDAFAPGLARDKLGCVRIPHTSRWRDISPVFFSFIRITFFPMFVFLLTPNLLSSQFCPPREMG